MDYSTLGALLGHLSASDNLQRASAEDLLEKQWLLSKDSAAQLLLGLVHFLSPEAAPELQMRSFAAILLRRLSLQNPRYGNGNGDEEGGEGAHLESLSMEQTKFIQQQLLHYLINETLNPVRNKIADTLSHLASYWHSNEVPWPELLQAMMECLSCQNPSLREAAFTILGAEPTLLLYPNASMGQMPPFDTAFLAGLQDSNIDVSLAALRACVYFLLESDDTTRPALASRWIPDMVRALQPMLANSDRQDAVLDALTYLIELAEIFPKTYRPILAQLIPFMIEIMNNAEAMEKSTRQTALEMILTLCENAPAMMKKQQGLSQAIVPILLSWMHDEEDLEDDPEWYTTEDVEDDDNESNPIVAEQALDRLARSLGGPLILPVAFSVIPSLLCSPEWQKRHGALRAISAIGEGCFKIMKAELDKVVNIVIPHLQDPHPRVRHAACNAIGQMCTDFEPFIQEKFHQQIVSQLVLVMDDTAHPRVQSYAAAAMVNFAESARKEQIAPYLDLVFERLLILLNTGKRYIQEQAITTIATVADSAGDQFEKYYSSIMPLLMNVLSQASQKEFRMLRGKTLECATLIALAVGKPVFGRDAPAFIEILKSIQASITDTDDPQSSYLLAAWARICKVLGTDFAPFLDLVLPHLFTLAQVKPDFTVLDDDDENIDYDKYNEEEGWEFVQVEGQRIGIKTSILEDKCTAVEMLICYAQEMGAAFHPYVPKVMGMVVPLLKFYFHDGVRFAAASVIPLLFKSLVDAKQPVAETWNDVCEKMLNVIAAEPDPSFISHLFMSFHECVSYLGAGCMSPQLYEKFMAQVQTQLKEYLMRLDGREVKRKQGDYDGEEDTLQNDEESDETLLSELSRCFHELLKTQGTNFYPCIDVLLPSVTELVHHSNPACRQWAICVFDDIIEFTGPSSAVYLPHFGQIMNSFLLDPAAPVRQASAYGVGVAAQFGGEAYIPLCSGSLQNLFASVSAPVPEDSNEGLFARENALSAIGKICHFASASGAFDLNSVLGQWISALPLVKDEEEAAHTYGYLLDLLDAQHPVAISMQSHITFVLTEALAAQDLLQGAPQKELAGRVVARLRGLLSSMSEADRGALWNGLSADKRQTLQSRGYF